MEQASHAAQCALYIQYQARLPPRSPRFYWPDDLYLLAAQSTLDTILFDGSENDSCEEYDRAFLKHLIKRLDHAVEGCTEENAKSLGFKLEDIAIDDALLFRYMALISLPEECSFVGAKTPHVLTTRHYFPVPTRNKHKLLGSAESIVLREDGAAISQGTTGLKTWEASLRLGAYLVQEQDALFTKNVRILEVSGAGFLGVLCARLLQARHTPDASLCLTDLEGIVLDRLRETALRSKYIKIHSNADHLPSLRIHSVDWNEVACRETPSYDVLFRERANLILAADVVYDPNLIGALVETIYSALGREHHTNNEPRHALVASTVRNPDTYAKFLEALATKQLVWRPINVKQVSWPGIPHLPIFPSVHDAIAEGSVVILDIQSP